ncbi:hypothetical protein BDR06DRAFT_971212 [Suillus hirtellus]|nr:hypothetical protein BDR06DRAFT_971212 [Suillus hirtellus]
MTFAKPLVIFTSLENLSPSAIDDLLDSVRNGRQMNVYTMRRDIDSRNYLAHSAQEVDDFLTKFEIPEAIGSKHDTTAGKKGPQDKEFEAQISLIVFPSEIKTACVHKHGERDGKNERHRICRGCGIATVRVDISGYVRVNAEQGFQRGRTRGWVWIRVLSIAGGEKKTTVGAQGTAAFVTVR